LRIEEAITLATYVSVVGVRRRRRTRSRSADKGKVGALIPFPGRKAKVWS
jgi:hypothetical protein